MRRTSRQSEGGFTLVEVLVALAIVGIGMVAVFGQMGQAAATADYLRLRTFASWVASDRITEARLLPEPPGLSERTDEYELAGYLWRYRIVISETEVPNVRRVDVEVSLDDSPDNVLAESTGFLNAVPVSTDTGASPAWAPQVTEGELQ